MTIYWDVMPGDKRKKGKPIYFHRKENEQKEVEFEVKLKWFERVSLQKKIFVPHYVTSFYPDYRHFKLLFKYIRMENSVSMTEFCQMYRKSSLLFIAAVAACNLSVGRKNCPHSCTSTPYPHWIGIPGPGFNSWSRSPGK